MEWILCYVDSEFIFTTVKVSAEKHELSDLVWKIARSQKRKVQTWQAFPIKELFDTIPITIYTDEDVIRSRLG